MILRWSLVGVFCFLAFANAWVERTYLDEKENWNWFFGPVFTVSASAIALISFIRQDYGYGVLYSAFAAIGAWWWWNDYKNERRRKRLLGRLWGRVMDLGGRLAVKRPRTN